MPGVVAEGGEVLGEFLGDAVVEQPDRVELVVLEGRCFPFGVVGVGDAELVFLVLEEARLLVVEVRLVARVLVPGVLLQLVDQQLRRRVLEQPALGRRLRVLERLLAAVQDALDP